jgi:hypothetical protein
MGEFGHFGATLRLESSIEVGPIKGFADIMLSMRFLASLACLVLVTALGAGQALADSPTTQPAADAAPQLQILANQALARNDYLTALPILEKVKQLLDNQPDQLGPVLEEIRVCRRQISKGIVAPPPVSTPVPVAVAVATPMVIKDVNGDPRQIHPAPSPGQTVDLAIKELGNFEYDPDKGGNIPDDVKRLEGCHIRTHGYMIPLDQAESITEFALVPSLFACCFGQPPQIQHTIVVHCPKGKAVSYFGDELAVEGTLHVQEIKDGGFIVSIFQIDASSVRAAAR